MPHYPEKRIERCFVPAAEAESLLAEADRLIQERADNDRELLKVLVRIKCEKVYLLAGCKSFREYVDVRLRKSYRWAERHIRCVAAENVVSSVQTRLLEAKCEDRQLEGTRALKIPKLTFTQIEVLAKVDPLVQHKAAETALRECQGMTPKATEAHLNSKYAKVNTKKEASKVHPGDRKRRAMQNRVLHNLRMVGKGLKELGVLDPFEARIDKLAKEIEQTFLVKGKL